MKYKWMFLLLLISSSCAVKESIDERILFIKPKCIEGYSFLIIYSRSLPMYSRGVAVVQILETHDKNYPPQPIKC